MKLKMYAIFDSAAAMYQRPIFARADGEVLREFKNLSVDSDHPCGQHPEDYSLFRIGVFYDHSGEVVGHAPECIGRAHELAAAQGNGIAVEEHRLPGDGQIDIEEAIADAKPT